MFFRPEPLKGPTMRADFMFGFHYLVGGSTPLKNMSSSVGMINYSQYINIWKVIKFHGSKPPTSQCSPHSIIELDDGTILTGKPYISW